MKFFGIPLLFLFVFGLSSCNSNTKESADQDSERFFFDLKEFVKEETAYLTSKSNKIKKVLEINGVKEEFETDSLDFKGELALFGDSDINKVSWADKYKGDTLIENGIIQKIAYQALDDKLKTRFIEIGFKEGQAQSLSIRNEINSFIIKAEQDLSYQKGQGYTIKQMQKIRLLKEKKLSISVNYQ